MDQVFLKLFNMSVSAGWLILAVMVLRLLLGKAPKWMRCILWAIAAVRLLCPFSIESIFSLVPSAETISPQTMQYASAPLVHSGIPVVDNTLNPLIQESVKPNPQIPVNPLQIWFTAAGIVWAAGLALLLLFALAGYFRVRRNVSEAALFQKNIWFCDNVQSPFILGLIRPQIYLPSDIDNEHMRYVLAHEQAHLKRKDHIWKVLGYVLQSVYWFNPLVWAAYALFCKDVELACDEKVAKHLSSSGKKAYSRALLACSMPKSTVAACPLAFGETSVKERVRSVLTYKKPAFWAIIAAAAGCVVVALCFLTNPGSPEDTGISSGSNSGSGPLPAQLDVSGAPDNDDALLPNPSANQPDTAGTPDNDDALLSGPSANQPDISGTPDSNDTQLSDPSANQPDGQDQMPSDTSGNLSYDSLIAEARDVLENGIGPNGEMSDHFSWVFYQNNDYETLGYLFRDLDGNGVDELIFGENGAEGWNGILYDLYTIVDGNVIHIFDGWERNRYYLCENGCIANEGSGGASESIWAYYSFSGTGLTLIEAVLFYEGRWIYSTAYSDQEDISPDELTLPEGYREITPEEAEAIMAKYVYEYPQFTPFT